MYKITIEKYIGLNEPNWNVSIVRRNVPLGLALFYGSNFQLQSFVITHILLLFLLLLFLFVLFDSFIWVKRELNEITKFAVWIANFYFSSISHYAQCKYDTTSIAFKFIALRWTRCQLKLKENAANRELNACHAMIWILGILSIKRWGNDQWIQM